MQPEHTIRCSFIDHQAIHDIHYACNITAANINNDNQPIRFINEPHLASRTDDHVEFLLRSAHGHPVNIRVLTADVVKNFPNIRYISLQNVNMERVNFDTFQRCQNLHTIQISSNQIQHLSNGLFRNCRNLQFLDLSSNHLSNYHPELFNGLHSLRRLWLTNNFITYVADDTFKHVATLTELVMTSQNVYSISEHLLAPLENLEFLRAWSFSEIHQNTFSNLINLRWLELNGRYLRELPDGFFRNQTRLIYLELVANSITRLNRESFGDHPLLIYFGVMNNQLNEVDPRLFQSFPNLQQFDSRYNVCINETLFNVTLIDFETNPIMERCFFNWFNPPSSDNGSEGSAKIYSLMMLILTSLMIIL